MIEFVRDPSQLAPILFTYVHMPWCVDTVDGDGDSSSSNDVSCAQKKNCVKCVF